MQNQQFGNILLKNIASLWTYENKPKGLEVAKEDQIAHMPYGMRHNDE